MKMHEIISTLDKIDLAAHRLVETAHHDMDLELAITSKITENSVSIQQYRIDIILNEFAGTSKKFYTIVDTDTAEIVYAELGLFETALSMVKRLLTGKHSGLDELKLLDDAYSNSLYEVYMYKGKANRGINEDVMVAKLSQAKYKLQDSKLKILRKL